MITQLQMVEKIDPCMPEDDWLYILLNCSLTKWSCIYIYQYLVLESDVYLFFNQKRAQNTIYVMYFNNNQNHKKTKIIFI